MTEPSPKLVRDTIGSLFDTVSISIKVPRFMADFAQWQSRFHCCTKNYFWLLMAFDYLDRHYGELKQHMLMVYYQQTDAKCPVPPSPFDEKVLSGMLREIFAERAKLSVRESPQPCNVEIDPKYNTIELKFNKGMFNDRHPMVKELMAKHHFRRLFGHRGLVAACTQDVEESVIKFANEFNTQTDGKTDAKT